MCIIAIKQAGVAMPTNETITEMWWNNRDGAGIMYPYAGKVRIIKGLMTLNEVYTAIARIAKDVDLFNTPIVLHFRIGTHGGNTPENTHPFPVTDKIPLMQKPLMFTNLGVAHNGIIYSATPRTGISDTMEYIATQMSLLKKIRPMFYKDKNCMKLIENAIDSKMVFLDKDGFISTIGLFIKGKDNIWYSNDTYKVREYSYLKDSAYFGDDGYSYTYSRGKEKIEVRSLFGMYLDDRDGYVQYQNGTIGEFGTHGCYVLGEDGNLYFETSTGTVIRLMASAQAHTGLPMRFEHGIENRDYDWFYMTKRNLPALADKTAGRTDTK